MKEIFEKQKEIEEPIIPKLIRMSREKKAKGISRRVRKKIEELELLKLELQKAKLTKEIEEISRH